MTEPVRVFIGSSGKNRVEQQVFVHSLRRHASAPVEVNIIDGDTGAARLHDGRVLSLPEGVGGGVGRATAFSLARYAIPGWCGYRGRAVYCDSDQLAFADVAELARWDLQGATLAAVPVRDAICAAPYRRQHLAALSSPAAGYVLTSVMVIDCAQARAWDLQRIAAALDGRHLDYAELMFAGREFRERFATRVTALDPRWNCLDRVVAGSKLLHFTDLRSQPWLFPHSPVNDVWERELWAAVDAGDVARPDLATARREGGVALRIAATACLPRALRSLASRAWRGLELLNPLLALRRLGDAIEATLPGHVWRWRPRLTLSRRVRFWFGAMLARVGGTRRREVIGVLYSLTCERVLEPLLGHLAARTDLRVTAYVPRGAGVTVSKDLVSRLERAGCTVDRAGTSLVRACARPARARVVFALDHRLHYRHHQRGIVVSEVLGEHGVPTACLQHGGCRADSVDSLASSASARLLVWGELTRRELVDRCGVAPSRVTVVGNPLHDRLPALRADAVRGRLAQDHPAFARRLAGRKLVLLATTVQREYARYPDEQERYARYLRHLYASMDFAAASLVVRAHPYDLVAGRNLYRELLPATTPADAVLVLPHAAQPDTYELLVLADLLLTRCSTVAEEALLLGKPVVAFDLDESGPARDYGCLAAMGRYTLTYAEPPGALAAALREGLAAGVAPVPPQVVAALTHALDGRALQRAADAVAGGVT